MKTKSGFIPTLLLAGYLSVLCLHSADRGSSSASAAPWSPADAVARNDGAESLRWKMIGSSHAGKCQMCWVCSPQPEPGRDLDGVAAGSIPPAATPIMRVAYVIPSNRSPQSHGIQTLQNAVRWWHVWFHDAMSRQGFESKSFRYETEEDGVTPLIHIVNVDETDAELRDDPWGAVIDAAAGAGVPTWVTGQVWLIVPEMHMQLPDGSIEGGVALGASFGSGLDPGVAVLGSNGLAMMQPSFLTNDQNYHGTIVPEIGPHPLVQGVSFWSFEGPTFSSVASSFLGAGVHELTHAFGIGHDFRNDVNAHGNMMGNGLRGFRGSAFPAAYLQDAMRLSYGHALTLNTSRYFLPEPVSVETIKPTLTVSTTGAVAPVDGHLEIHFNASDASGLAVALLRRNGDTIGELPLSGTSVSDKFRTPYFTAGVTNQYQVSVYDVHGNRRDVDRNITPIAGFNVAPRAEFRVIPSTAQPNQNVTLNAFVSNDPDHPSNTLQVEWDLNGDGEYDTVPTTSKTLATSFAEPGAYRIGLRVTDPSGAQSEASPISLLVRRQGDLNGDGEVGIVDLLLLLASWGACPEMPTPCPADLTPSEFGDGQVDIADLLLLLANWG